MKTRPTTSLILSICFAGITYGIAGAAESTVPVIKTFDLETATLDDVQEAMRLGELSSVELTLLYLNRIAAYDKTTGPIGLNTVPALNPDVIAEAARADKLRRQGVDLGPLHGVPFTAKGNYNFKGMATTDGISVWADFTAPYTSHVIEALQEKGAVFLGHNNLDTFQSSTGSTNSQTFGLARNAYNREFATGGSSGGSGSSVGANLTFFALGGETGGSVRSPSERAGIVGYKTSQSLISVRGLAPLAWDRDVVGPMTRYAVDNAHVMEAASKEDPANVWSSVTVDEGRPRPVNFASQATTSSLAGKKFGILTNSVGTSDTGVAGAIKQVFAEAKATLEAAGATVVEVTAPPELDITFTGRRRSLPDTVLTPPTRKLYSPVTTDLTGNMVAGSRAYAFKTFLDSMVTLPGDTPEQIHDKVVARISPVTQLPQQYRTSIAEKTTFGPGHPDTVEHFQAVKYMIHDYELFLADNGVDALIFPTVSNKTASGLTLPNLTRALINSFSLPAVTVPMGTVEVSGSVEPTTIQFVGRFLQDDKLLALAAAYERASQKRIVSPLVPPLDGESFELTMDSYVRANSPYSPPLLVVKKRATAKKTAGVKRLEVGGNIRLKADVATIRAWVNGQSVPVAIKGRQWKGSVSVEEILPYLTPGSKTAELSVLAEDSEGNTSATVLEIRVPKKL
ncbi:amidase [Luteolibacter flavescens]|uniref:Amidase n=1 Tax=Luteolibacter flavescens TaxID=1859460 RepID=A0ABT3FN54_9BACT|nr:amidase [Luteolibacter flavescens]MCW1885005.1 amidase [Luteolibacter flavescens]